MTKAFITVLLAGLAAPAQAATDQYNLYCQGTFISGFGSREQIDDGTWSFRIDEANGFLCSDDEKLLAGVSVKARGK